LRSALRRIQKTRRLICFLSAMLTLLSIVPPSGLAEEKRSEGRKTLKRAAVVLQGILSRKDVPLCGLEKADCIVVRLDGGRGVMSCRTGRNFSGPAPALYIASRVNSGLQYGGSFPDFVLLITTQNGVDRFLEGKTKVGSHASVAPRVASANSKWGCDPFLALWEVTVA
jgi:lipid-binding SYLF domain-containing protein